MRVTILRRAVAATALSIVVPLAHGALHDRGGGLIYDDVLNVTWLQDVMLPAGTSYDDDYANAPKDNGSTDGMLSYYAAQAWVADLEYFDPARGVVWRDWRLPEVQPVNGVSFNVRPSYDGSTDVGYNITSAMHELAYMYYVNFKNKGQYDSNGTWQSGYGLVDDPEDPNDESLFVNLKKGLYWSSTVRPDNDDNAWDFRMQYGNTTAGDFRYVRYVLAVMDGDVGATPPIQINSFAATPTALLDTQTSALAVVATDPEPGPSALSYLWEVVSGDGTVQQATSANAVYAPENLSANQTVTLRVTVSDGEATVARELTIQVSDADAASPNVAPAIVGVTATPSTIWDTQQSQLQVTATDSDGPSALSYQWTIVNGEGLLDGATVANPWYTPADVVGTQNVTLRVTVSDGAVSVSQDVTLAVLDANAPPPGTQTAVTYDFTWYSGALEVWCYQGAGRVFVDVFEDPAWPDSVFFRFRNGLGNPLYFDGQLLDHSLSSIVGIQLDTGTALPGMFTSVIRHDAVGYVEMPVHIPGTPQTLLDQSGSISRIAWSGDFGASRRSESLPKTDGINIDESLTLRAQLAAGVTFANVVAAMDVGMSDAYVSKDSYLLWTTAEKTLYRATATAGLRVAMEVNSIVPNTWDPDGHALYVSRGRVDPTAAGAPQITSVTATPMALLDTQTSALAVVATDPEPGPSALSYLWEVVSGDGTVQQATSANAVYAPENLSANQTVTLRVTVSDGEATVARELTIQVSDADAASPNVAPAIVGVTATPSTIWDTQQSQLQVTATDSDGPSALSYQWTIVSGGGLLDSATVANPWYTPADVVGTQNVTLRVTVSDGAVSVSQDVTLTVQDVSPPPPGVRILGENFTSGSFAGWSYYDEGSISAPSKWLIVSGELAQQSNIRDGGNNVDLTRAGTYLLWDEGLGWTDYKAHFKMRSTDDDALGMMFRYIDADNYYRFSWDQQLKQRRLVKKAGGVFTLLAADNVPYIGGQSYHVELIAQGAQLEVWIDGTRIFQVNDASHGRGSVAFYAWQNNAAFFDELVVEDLSGGNFNALPKITGLTASPSTILDNQTSQIAVTAVDTDGPDALNFQWSVVSGGGVLDDANSATPIYIPVDVAGTQTVKLKVEVSDGAATVSGNLALRVEDAEPPPSGPLLMSDDFGGSLDSWNVVDEGTISAPSKWRVVSGTLAQQSNIRDGGTSKDLPRRGTYLLYWGGAGWGDYRARFNLRSTDDDSLGFVFRYGDADNYYRFSWDKERNQRWLLKRAGGVYTLLAADNVPYVLGQDYLVEIVAQDTLLQVWIDGERVFEVDDASLAIGTVGFYSWQNTGAFFDDIQVNAIE